MISQIQRTRLAVKRTVLIVIALFIATSAGVPVYVHADDSSTTPKCSPAVSDPAGIQKPTGADSVTYTYNSCTGLWENPHYTWSPETKVKSPKEWPTYTCNSSTKKWEALVWAYSPAKNAWYQSAVAVDTPPSAAPKIDCPAPAPSNIPQSGTTGQQASSSPVGGTGSVTNQPTNNTSVDSTTTATMDNQVVGTSASGSAIVLANTTGGDATSGSAQAVANVINMLQSSTSLGDNTVTFVANIDGNVQGDLILDPNALQPASGTSTINTAASNNLTLNSSTAGAINNTINLSATSGDATVSKNTSAGDATTGDAQAIANIVNVLNSMVAAKQSFIGVININGDFTGNILVPQSFLDSLIASNAPHSTVTVSNDTLQTLNATFGTNQSINNSITSTATSGSATVEKNTEAGSATTGNASTNVTLFDLTSTHVMAKNTMLVFVNVLGNWVGLIMDAPAGTTVAALGSGVTESSTTASNLVEANVNTTSSITNNINVAAASGDAMVSYNTEAGNATSGDAHTAVNILNLVSSDFSLSNWFGILFINVFGNWYGSFGVAPPPVKDIAHSGTSGKMQPQPTKTYSFIPYAKQQAAAQHADSTSNPKGDGLDKFSPAFVKAVRDIGTQPIQSAVKSSDGAVDNQGIQQASDQAMLVSGGLIALGLTTLVIDRRKSRIASVQKR